MIAPRREVETANPSKRQMLRARMAIAAALLPIQASTRVSRLGTGIAWAWALWMVLVASVYATYFMSHFFQRLF